jgi:hypothetical protein
MVQHEGEDGVFPSLRYPANSVVSFAGRSINILCAGTLTFWQPNNTEDQASQGKPRRGFRRRSCCEFSDGGRHYTAGTDEFLHAIKPQAAASDDSGEIPATVN